MKTLIAITGCQKFRDRANNQRATWVKDNADPDIDIKFFVGYLDLCRPAYLLPDEVLLLASDEYNDRKDKVLALVRWALDHGYDRLIKVDDDTYVRPERLASLPEIDYGGFLQWQVFMLNGVNILEAENVLGPFVVLSRKAMGLLLGPDLHPGIYFEDVWVSKQMKGNGITRVDLRPRIGYRLYNSIAPSPRIIPAEYQQTPLATNDLVAAFEFRTETEMKGAHAIFETSKAVAMVGSLLKNNKRLPCSGEAISQET